MSQMPPPMTAPGAGGGMKPHRATTILIMGIAGLLCWPVGLAAWIMGNKDLKEMDAGSMDAAGRKNTNIGKICGMVFTILGLLGTAFRIYALSR